MARRYVTPILCILSNPRSPNLSILSAPAKVCPPRQTKLCNARYLARRPPHAPPHLPFARPRCLLCESLLRPPQRQVQPPFQAPIKKKKSLGHCWHASPSGRPHRPPSSFGPASPPCHVPPRLPLALPTPPLFARTTLHVARLFVQLQSWSSAPGAGPRKKISRVPRVKRPCSGPNAWRVPFALLLLHTCSLPLRSCTLPPWL